MKFRNACVIGGTSGLGLSLATELRLRNKRAKIVVVGRKQPRALVNGLDFVELDLSIPCSNWDFCKNFDLIIYAAGMGRLTGFDTILPSEVERTISVNTTNVVNIIHAKKKDLLSRCDFKLAIVTSVAARLPSPLFALYAASKAFVHSYIFSVNIELTKRSSANKILEVAPGFLDGTSFYGKPTDLMKLRSVSRNILRKISLNVEYNIPENYSLYEGLIKKSQLDPKKFGLESYEYKLKRLYDKR